MVTHLRKTIVAGAVMLLAAVLVTARSNAAAADPPHGTAQESIDKSLGPWARLVAKGDGYLVHALPSLGGEKDHPHFARRFVYPGAGVVYTDVRSGRMRRLVHTGTWAVNTERISYHTSRVIGIAADAERLYVAVWNSGRLWDRPPNLQRVLSGGTYQLSVFRLADGKGIGTFGLMGSLPKTAPKETVDAGVLKPVAGGVSCFGAKYQFKGDELIRPSDPAKDRSP